MGAIRRSISRRLWLGALGATCACNSILGNPAPGGEGSGGLGGEGQSGSGPGAGSGGKSDEGSGGSVAGAAGSTSSGSGSNAGGGGSGSTTRSVPCGLNDRGSQEQRRVDGDWEDDGDCDDPDECTDEAVEQDAPCADDKGNGTRSCVLGSWVTGDCDCTEPSEDYDVLADACLAPIPCNPQGDPFGGGDGVTTPHAICSALHLSHVSDAPSARFVLAESLDLSDVENFEPIGPVFTGEFDGAGRALVGLTIDRSSATLGVAESSVGLFGILEDISLVRDLELRDFDVFGGGSVGTLAGRISGSDPPRINVEGVRVLGDGTVIGEGSNVGGLAGSADYTLINDSSSTGDVTGEASSVGGLVGYLIRASVDHCTTSGDVVGGADVGGMIGLSELSTVTDVAASGAVTGTTSVGGLVGDSEQFASGSGGILRGIASGAVTGTAAEVGGLVGRKSEGSIADSSASGSVSGQSRVGGLVGFLTNYAVLSKSSGSGNVSGETYVGGLVGYDSSNMPAIDQCWASGNVTGGAYVGGLVGTRTDFYSGQNAVAESYAFGLVTWSGSGSRPANIGALMGDVDDSIIDSSRGRSQDPSLPLVGVLGGTSSAQDSTLMSAAAFGSQANFAGWDFASVWVLSTELGRPILQWQADE